MSYLVANPEDRFFRDEDHIIVCIVDICIVGSHNDSLWIMYYKGTVY